MVEISTQILNEIKLLIEELNNNNIKILEAYIFGSYANNSQKEWSDIDIALISEKFEGCRFTDKDKIRDIYLKINWKFSPYPVSIEQYKNSWFVKKEILQKGIRVY